MHQQALQGVADAGTLHLAVENDVQGLVQVRVRVHEGMADALVMLEHRHGGGFGHGTHQTFATARDHDVDILVEFAQLGDRGVIRGRHQLGRIGGQTGFF